MPEKIVKHLEKKGITQKVYDSLDRALPETDVLYMTRIQRERFATEEDYKRVSQECNFLK
jgi:carbamoyl-phosphate synthase/aspartate carbamoyltransferase/dihydroorotase